MALKLLAEVGLDGRGFATGIRNLERGAAQFGSALKSVALQAFGIYSIQQAFAKTLETADELVTASKRLGVGVEQLQVLREAAKENNTEMEKLARAFEKINVAREKALRGGPEGEKLMSRFGQLGITRQDLQSRTAADLFTGPLARAAATRNQEEVGPILRDILGRGFGEVLPVLQEDFGALEKRMRSMGAIMSGETAVGLDMLGDQMTLLSQIITSSLAPAIISMAEIILSAVGKLKEFGAFLGSISGSRGGIFGASRDEINYRRLKKESDRAEELGMTEPGSIKFQSMFGNLGPRARVPTAEERAWMDTYEKAFDAAAMSMSESGDEWAEKLAALRRRIDEEAAKLRKPVAPTFETEDKEGKQAKMKLPEGDALTRIGNFYGSNMDPIRTIAEQQLGVLRRIESNTRPRTPSGGPTIPRH